MFVVAPAGFRSDDLSTMAPIDDRWNVVVDRPVLLDGRRPQPDRVDEVLVNEEAADRLGVELGSVLTLSSFTSEQMERLTEGQDAGEPAGPEIEVTVVGVGRTELEVAGSQPLILLTPAFYALHRYDIGHFDEILHVRLTHGDQDVAAFQEGVRRVVPESEGVTVTPQADSSTSIEDATGVQAVSLVIFAIAAGLAGFVAIGEALARQTALSTDDQIKLHALGLSRRQRFTALIAPAALVTVTGAAVAVGVALLASPVMPTGLARRAEPDPGFAADWLVLGLGFVAVAILVSGRAAISAWRTAGRLELRVRPGWRGAGGGVAGAARCTAAGCDRRADGAGTGAQHRSPAGGGDRRLPGVTGLASTIPSATPCPATRARRSRRSRAYEPGTYELTVLGNRPTTAVSPSARASARAKPAPSPSPTLSSSSAPSSVP
jgi:hypothetical protein